MISFSCCYVIVDILFSFATMRVPSRFLDFPFLSFISSTIPIPSFCVYYFILYKFPSGSILQSQSYRVIMTNANMKPSAPAPQPQSQMQSKKRKIIIFSGMPTYPPSMYPLCIHSIESQPLLDPNQTSNPYPIPE